MRMNNQNIEPSKYVAFGTEFGGTYYGTCSSVLGAKRLANKYKRTDCKLLVYRLDDTESTGNGCRYPLKQAEPVAFKEKNQSKWLWNTW